MISSVSRAASWTLEQLEDSLLPSQGRTLQKVACYGYQFFKFCVFLPLAVTTNALSLPATWIRTRRTDDPPLIAFAKHPQWSSSLVEAAPIDIGFATSDFQENGPQEHPGTNWSSFYQNNSQRLGPLGQCPDIWHHPERVITRLDELGVKKFRFSVSRDKVEPLRGGPIDQSALQHYRDFCRELIRHGIEPMVTLHHFSDPTYFSWERAEDLDGFVRYAESVTDALYEMGLRKIVTFNEPAVVAFSGWIMGDFPPHHRIDFEGAGQVLENMMRAHTRVYDVLKACHPDIQIGLTHDPIRFRHYHKVHPLWTPAEKLLCHYLNEVNHNALMRCFMTGKFSLKVPFRTNYTFELPKPPPLDFIGLQYYSDPLIKLSWTGGTTVTRNAEERLNSFGCRVYPQGLASALEEFRCLGIPIDLTEIGVDTAINNDPSDRERIKYFDRIFQVVKKALDVGVPVRSLHFWTLIDNLEWYKAWAIRFGFYSFDSATGLIAPRPVSQWLKDRISARQASQR